MKQWYEELFENYSRKYEEESFTKGTLGEVDLIEREIRHNKGAKILDIGCGTGRHSIELAKRGYDVTGVDLSEEMLEMAGKKAKEAGVTVRFRQMDARKMTFRGEFDLVIMVCEGGFPLMETDEMNFAILQGAERALKNDGKLIFTTLNGLFPLFHSVKDFINENSTRGAVSKTNSFDLMTFRDHSDFEVVLDDGSRKTLECNERYYVPSEITWLLKGLGFTDISILGCRQGAWSRDDMLTTEDYEMLVIANKK